MSRDVAFICTVELRPCQEVSDTLPFINVELVQVSRQVDHTPVAIATQGTFGYVQNRVLRPLDDASAATGIAALVEEFFPVAALTDMHAFYGSDGTDADLNDRITRLMASCARFGADRDLDLVPTSRYTFGG